MDSCFANTCLSGRASRTHCVKVKRWTCLELEELMCCTLPERAAFLIVSQVLSKWTQLTSECVFPFFYNPSSIGSATAKPHQLLDDGLWLQNSSFFFLFSVCYSVSLPCQVICLFVRDHRKTLERINFFLLRFLFLLNQIYCFCLAFINCPVFGSSCLSLRSAHFSSWQRQRQTYYASIHVHTFAVTSRCNCADRQGRHQRRVHLKCWGGCVTGVWHALDVCVPLWAGGAGISCDHIRWRNDT